MRLILTTSLLSSAAALPYLYNESEICENGACEDYNAAYKRIFDIQPGFQWNDAGGYCGSWSIQRAALGKGAWISQQQVRDATSDGGGNDHEILSTNIHEAYKNLKISVEYFDFENEPTPQQDAYAKWLKKQLVAGNPVTWMIMWHVRQTYPIYNLTAPHGCYGHIEPVIGIQSRHPLDDETVYDDDVVVHLTDNGWNSVNRKLSSLGGQWSGPGSRADCGQYNYCMATYAFGWAVKDFMDEAPALPAFLHVKPSLTEPDTRAGEPPSALQGNLTVTGLTKGSLYDIYRWDTIKDAFTYTDAFKKTTFTATGDTHVYQDEHSFQSDGTTYYRCVPFGSNVFV